MTLVESGADYCRKHHGIRNEDESVCDFVSQDPWDPEYDCGHAGAEFGSIGCEACDADGVTLCDLTPLLYENGETS